MTLIDIASRWAELIVVGSFTAVIGLYRWDRKALHDKIEKEELRRSEEIESLKEDLEQRMRTAEERREEMRHQLNEMMCAIEEQGQRIARIEATADLILRNMDRTNHDQLNVR